MRKGIWKNRAEHNDHLWAECSECGFKVENYKAVVTGRSSDDYVSVKYNYCPICGAKMSVQSKEILATTGEGNSKNHQPEWKNRMLNTFMKGH